MYIFIQSIGPSVLWCLWTGSFVYNKRIILTRRYFHLVRIDLQMFVETRLQKDIFPSHSSNPRKMLHRSSRRVCLTAAHHLCTSPFIQALSCSPNVIGICAPAAPPIMLRIGTHSLNHIPNPNPNPNPTHVHTHSDTRATTKRPTSLRHSLEGAAKRAVENV